MAKFALGQAVRVVGWAHSGGCPPTFDRSHLIGTESFITEIDHWHDITIYGTAHAPILRIDIPGLYRAISAFFDEELEPAIPPGMESTEQTDALYLPELETTQ